MNITLFPPEKQADGAFDGGKIVEKKPIGFPGENSQVKRVGPLFYWAWAVANEDAVIGSHPHKAFEILTYVLAGEVDHQDSLGSRQRVGPGGVQVIQAGSGVYHSEGFGKGAQGFQIWFEPDLRETIKNQPTYHQYDHAEFPVEEKNGVKVKTVIGDRTPVSLVTPVKMFDVDLPAGKIFSHPLPAGHALAVLAVQGNGLVLHPQTEEKTAVQQYDFVVITADQTESAAFLANTENLRIVMVEVPQSVDYPLYKK